ncbi:MAG TPA: serine/threonine-protein kinase [Trebonia sp.]|nr:serine/threonine-protein kinase [Trebonia sp.]
MEPLTAADPTAVREFRVLARLGAGGMGRVYLAASPAGRFIAIKVIHPQLAYDPEFIRRFRGEADAAQRVSGLYTAPVVAAGVDDSPPWLATAFVPGPSLHEVVTRHGPLPPAALWRLAAGLAEALRAIHAAGLVHRDLKPGNVLLAPDGPRVIDFGISRAVAAGTRMTATGAAIGTPGYMSPEQVEGAEVGPASDVFSFGSVLGFAAAGASPFAGGPGASVPSVMFRVAHGEPALARLSGDVREVVAACLAKDPARRPDLGQVAARSTAAVEYLGLSPTGFWPDDVALVIDAQVAALSAELRTLPVPAGQPRPPEPLPVMNQPGYPGPGYPGGQFPGTPAGTQPPSRRGVLIGIGAGVAGVAAVAGGAAWAASALAGGSKSPGNAGTGSGSQAWRFAASQQPGPPTVADGLVYFGSGLQGAEHCPFYAVSVQTGQQAWMQTPDMISAAPTVAGGILCVVDATGELYAAHAVTGKQAWSVTTDYPVDAGEQTWDATATRVALAPGDGSVWLFNAATGKEVWRSAAPSAAWRYVAFSPAGTALYAFDPRSGLVAALDLGSGDQLWSVRMYGAGTGSSTGLFAGPGAVYAGTQDGSVYCVDTASRRLRWSYAVPGAAFPASDLVIAGGLVYFTDNSGVLRAVSAASGRQAWSYEVGSGTASPAPGVALAAGYAYVTTQNGVRQLHAASGAPGWSFSPGGGASFVTSTAAGGGLVFAGADDQAMYAIRA